MNKLQTMSTANPKPKKFSMFRKKPNDEKPEKMVKKKSRPITSTPTILSRDLKIEGQILGSGLIEIEGNVKGIIKGNSVILLETGTIEGEVIAESFSIRGIFQGTIRAQHVNISCKAQVTGSIEYNMLSIEDGASVDAKFKKSDEVLTD
jgi:cytoskeletal protein CcmA (bactofilin family)